MSMKQTMMTLSATLCGVFACAATTPAPAAGKESSGHRAPEAGLYLVIDLSGGTNAVSYPVSYLDKEPTGGWTRTHKTTSLVLRRIDPGTYTMGCPIEETGYNGGEAVPHKVTIDKPFYIGVFEVTQKQYELVTGTMPSSYKGDIRPVEDISWNTIRGDSDEFNWPASNKVDATTFIGLLRAKTGIDTFDLPTEARWEYACRAGTTNAFNSGKNLTNFRSGTDPQADEVTARKTSRNPTRRSARTGRTRGGCMTCTATCGNSAWTGTRAAVPSARRRQPTLSAPDGVLAACCAEGAGAAAPRTAVPRRGPASLLRAGTTTTASACPAPSGNDPARTPAPVRLVAQWTPPCTYLR